MTERSPRVQSWHDRLDRQLQQLVPGRRYRYWLSPTAAAWFSLEALSAEGTARFGDWLKRNRDVPAVVGLLWLDRSDRVVLCSSKSPEKVLQALARRLPELLPEVPHAIRLQHARALQAQVDLFDDEAIRSFSPTSEPLRAPELWTPSRGVDALRLAGVLDGLLPGQRVWYWLCDTPQNGCPPLVLTSADADPRMVLFEAWLSQLGVDTTASACRGFGQVDELGGLQLVGEGLSLAHLEAVAAYVHAHRSQAPALARLRDLELVCVEGRLVTEIHALPERWRGVPRLCAPGTVQEAAQVLESLQPRQNVWFWMTARSSEGPYVCLQPQSEGPFSPRQRWLLRRFPEARDRVYGVLRRLPSGALSLSTTQEASDRWAGIVSAVLAAHSDRFPALSELSHATLVVPRNEGVAAAHAQSQEGP